RGSFGVLRSILLFAASAGAHPVPFSYLDVQLQPGSIAVSLTIHIYDLAHDLQITPMERLLDKGFLADHQSAIQTMLSPRFELATDGHALSPEWLQPGSGRAAVRALSPAVSDSGNAGSGWNIGEDVSLRSPASD